MGSLHAFNVQKLINDFDLSVYVETGTGEAVCLKHALAFGFSKLYSIDIDKILIDNVKIEDPRLELICGPSREILPPILTKIDPQHNILFFLDAHFPEADFGTDPKRYIISFQKYKKDSIPLEQELRCIKIARPRNSDVILIDDVRIYEDGRFEGGNWSERPFLHIGDRNFVKDLFGESHNIEINYAQQGYLSLIPKI